MYVIYTLSLQEHKCNNTLIYYPNAVDQVDEHGFTKKNWNKGKKKLPTQAKVYTIGIHTRKQRQRNWEHEKVMVLMKVKKNEHVASWDKVYVQK